MKTPDGWPREILDLVDRGGPPPHPEDVEVRALLDRHPEHRDEVTTFLWLRREVHGACAGDLSESDAPIPEPVRAALRARAAATLAGTMPTARTEPRVAPASDSGSRGTSPPHRDTSEPHDERSPRIFAIVPILASAAAVLWLAFALFSTGRDTVVEGPSYAARFEARRITLRAADEPALVLRVRATLPAAGHLVVVGIRPDGEAFAIYPQLTERGLSYEGVRGPFATASQFVFPPVTEPALSMPDVDGDLSVVFATTSTELEAEGLRELVAAIEAASRAADPENRRSAIEDTLGDRFRAVEHVVLQAGDID